MNNIGRTLASAMVLLSFLAGPASAHTGNDTLTLYFAGDVMQHQSQLDHAWNSVTRTYNYSDYFRQVSPEIQNATFAVCNLETTLAGKPYSGYPAFCSPIELAQELKNTGFDICLTANNHCLDRGSDGLERTLDALDALGLEHLGTYRDSISQLTQHPYIIDWHGHRIALLSYTYGTNGIKVRAPRVVNYIDTTAIIADISRARYLGAELIIACMHWGTEYRLQPDNTQKSTEQWLYHHGVDHIIGGHPHVIEPVTEYRTRMSGLAHLTVWSLGNYISGMTAPNTDRGLGITLYLTDNGTGHLVLARYTLHGNRTVRPDYHIVSDCTSVPAVHTISDHTAP
ncbi:MAG: CapA family protein [Bacteroidaceae bacterium]|nr:CapA family protein [Bacteroidaceae bacterium]